jgi:siroheme synthase
MAPIVVISVAVIALCIGYHFGHRAGSRTTGLVTWKKRTKKRTSRTALARAALSLVLLLGARRVKRNYLTWTLKFAEPLELLRGGLSLSRFH